MHDSRIIANRFIELARADRRFFTPMQLLKLVYIAHGWMLGLYARPLIRDEIQAWQYGPVIPTIYNEVRSYRGAAIDRELNAPDEDLDPAEADIVRQVYQQYGYMSGIQLSAITHAAGTPWSDMYEPGAFGIPIRNDLIQEHYQSLLRQRAAAAAAAATQPH